MPADGETADPDQRRTRRGPWGRLRLLGRRSKSLELLNPGPGRCPPLEGSPVTMFLDILWISTSFPPRRLAYVFHLRLQFKALMRELNAEGLLEQKSVRKAGIQRISA